MGVAEPVTVGPKEVRHIWLTLDARGVSPGRYTTEVTLRPLTPSADGKRMLYPLSLSKTSSGDCSSRPDTRPIGWRQILQVVERIGFRDARILETGPRHIKLWVNGHSLGLVEVAGHQRLRY